MEQETIAGDGFFGRVWKAISWLAGFAILYVIFRSVGIDKVFVSLRLASLRLLVGSTALLLTIHLLRVFKWYVVLHKDYSRLEVAELFFSSKAYGDLAPARLGEFAPLLSGKYRRGKVAALLLVDRFFETYATLFLGAIGILLLSMQDIRIVASGIVAFLVLSTAFVLLTRTSLWDKLRMVFGEWPVLAQGFSIVASISHGFGTFRHLSWFLGLISLLAAALNVLFFQALFLSVGVHVGWSLAATMVFLAATSSLVAFTPWGLGIMEAPLWWLSRLYGLPLTALGAFCVLVRVIPLSSIWLLYGLTLLGSRYCRVRTTP